MNVAIGIRVAFALVIALLLALHGYKKRSLSKSGAIAAIVVGFFSFGASYRAGVILILFYYSSSKLTKVRDDIKSKLEEEYTVGGQRNWVQVFASSILATVVAILFYLFCGEDQNIIFGGDSAESFSLFGVNTSRHSLRAYLWVAYVAHYATANADTWASELGVLSKTPPRLVTTFLLRQVPPGTNGGMSILGTAASIAGGGFIGLIFWIGSFFLGNDGIAPSQYPMVIVGLVIGFVGSLIDSLLGATVQATYYSKDRKCIVKRKDSTLQSDSSIIKICGYDILSNEAVNFVSIAITMILSLWIGPWIYCLCDSSQCT